MTSLTMVFAEGQSATLLHAVKTICCVLDKDLFRNAQFKIVSNLRTSRFLHTRIGLAVTCDRDDFFQAFESLDRAGCWRIVGIVPSVSQTPWPNSILSVAEAFNDRCVLCEFDPPSIVAALRGIARDSAERTDPLPASYGILQRFLAARKLSRKLEVLLHGRSLDISNAILAPARMLCELNLGSTHAFLTSAWKDWLQAADKHRQEISKRFRDLPNTFPFTSDGLLIEFRAAWLVVSGWLFANTPPPIKSSHSSEVAQLRRLSELLTEIRLLSGKQPDLTRNRKVEVLPISRRPRKLETQEPLRVLVVDDYADCWRPVLNIVAAQLAEHLKQPLCVEFSIDGKFVNTERHGASDFWQVLPEYDLVLLDIYLPLKDNETGHHLLKRIRERLAWLPVILWTTSLDSRLAAKASLTNGYILKKTATCDDIFKTIDDSLRIGQARRRFSLPNPFFDHVISTSDLRHCAVSFTDWCLKYLDSFHALDSSYFKYFNDHGGRHIVGLLNILEKLIRPLLFNETVFSKAKEEREKEILSLYLAVLCHEFGMFPLGHTEGFAGHHREALNRIRDFHAINAFLTLMRDTHPRQKDFGVLLDMLKEKANTHTHAATALICAYHSRCLSLTDKDFGKLRFENAKKASNLNVDEKEELQRELRRAAQALDVRTGLRDRVANLCRVFRFADALDIDETRVPADFILFHPGRSARQDAEDLKRLVVTSVTIERGEVALRFNAHSPTSLNRNAKTEELPDFLKAFSGDLKRRVMPSMPVLFAGLKTVFSAAGLGEPDERDSVVAPEIKRILDAWLLRFFEHRLNATEGDAAIIASLSVICDIREEYAAIENCDLRRIIRLGSIEWSPTGERIKLFQNT